MSTSSISLREFVTDVRVHNVRKEVAGRTVR